MQYFNTTILVENKKILSQVIISLKVLSIDQVPFIRQEMWVSTTTSTDLLTDERMDS